jgi:hypothetical protein
MEQAMTTSVATRNGIKVKAAPKGCTATVYQFSVGTPEGRGAKFLRDRYAVAKAIDANHAVLTDGGTLEVEGATLYDLGFVELPVALPVREPVAEPVAEAVSEPAAEKPPIPSKSKLHRMDGGELIALADAHGIDITEARTKKRLVELLAAAR